MESKIIKIGTSLGVIVPGILTKDFGLTAGTKIEILINKENEIVIRKKTSIREGWDLAFARYAMEGEDELMIPDFMDAEAEQLM